MPVVEQLTGRTVVADGKERLYFSGTSYLGMNVNRDLAALIQEGGRRYGTTYSSSRNSNLKLAVYDDAENLLAAQVGAGAALTFSSGYLAGQALIRTLDKGQRFIYAPDAHPALWRHAADANHTDFEKWVNSLQESIAEAEGEVVIVVNSVDPLKARKYNFDWISSLPTDRHITLVVDDSHMLGLSGEKGAGTFPEAARLVKQHVELVVIASMGKALGIAGGVVLGTESRIASLRKSPYFIAGSPAPPAYMYAFVHAQELFEQARIHLTSNVEQFQGLIEHQQLFDYFDTYPVFYTKEYGLYHALEEEVIISCFSYPDPESEPITRVIINSLHTTDDLEALAGMIDKYKVGERVIRKV